VHNEPALALGQTRDCASSCSCFVTQFTFWRRERDLMKNSVATEGDEWIRRTVRAAAVPDMLPSLWTSVASPRASHLSECSARLAVAVDGKTRFHPILRADRTACGACETYEPGAVMFPALNDAPGPTFHRRLGWRLNSRPRNSRETCKIVRRCQRLCCGFGAGEKKQFRLGCVQRLWRGRALCQLPG
jgi:hypothetical protein